MVKGEYQLTDALDNMRKEGSKFKTADVTHWLDCGNKDATVLTNKVVLELNGHEKLVSPDAKIHNSVVIEPCYIGKGVAIIDSVVGPYVSLGENSKVQHSVVRNSIILNSSTIKDANIENSMIGNFSTFEGRTDSLNLGDYSEVK